MVQQELSRHLVTVFDSLMQSRFLYLYYNRRHQYTGNFCLLMLLQNCCTVMEGGNLK